MQRRCSHHPHYDRPPLRNPPPTGNREQRTGNNSHRSTNHHPPLRQAQRGTGNALTPLHAPCEMENPSRVQLPMRRCRSLLTSLPLTSPQITAHRFAKPNGEQRTGNNSHRPSKVRAIRAAEGFWSAVAETPGGVVDTALSGGVGCVKGCSARGWRVCGGGADVSKSPDTARPLKAGGSSGAKRSGQSGVAGGVKRCTAEAGGSVEEVRTFHSPQIPPGL